MRPLLIATLLASTACFSMGGPEAETPADLQTPTDPTSASQSATTPPTRRRARARRKTSGLQAHLELPAALARGAKPWTWATQGPSRCSGPTAATTGQLYCVLHAARVLAAVDYEAATSSGENGAQGCLRGSRPLTTLAGRALALDA